MARLTASERKQLLSYLSKDERVIELRKTQMVRPLNLLERVMLNQIVTETIAELF